MIFIFTLIAALCIYLTIQYSIFIPPVNNGLPILMYHKVDTDKMDDLTVSVEKLRSHFEYLSQNKYKCMPLADTISNDKEVKLKKCFVLTFDDAYLNNIEYLYPLLKQYDFHATIMLPVGLLGKTNEWDGGKDKLMNYGQLASMDKVNISFGFHTYKHISLKTSSLKEIKIDLQNCSTDLDENKMNVLPVLAYPYGAYPREKPKKEEFFKLLSSLGIAYGLRIGNKINKWPLKNNYEIKRIDIKGTDSFWVFKTKLKKGRVKLF